MTGARRVFRVTAGYHSGVRATVIWGAASTGGDGSVGFWDGLPGWTVVLVALAVVAAGVVACVLGPAGRPLATTRRTGGLTRALERARAEDENIGGSSTGGDSG